MVGLSMTSRLRPEGSMKLPQSFSGAPNVLAMTALLMSTGTGNSLYNWAKTSAAILLKSSMFGGV
jgi:hypothetical protein